jgi:uncharacterized protein YqeY
MLIDDLKKRMFAAIKAGNTLEKELFRTVIGEVTRTGDEATDERVTNVLKKMIKSAEETRKLVTDADKQAELDRELALLQTLVPQGMGKDALKQALLPVLEAIKAANNDGQATGVAMKHLKAAGVEADGKLVTETVRELRA